MALIDRQVTREIYFAELYIRYKNMKSQFQTKINIIIIALFPS